MTTTRHDGEHHLSPHTNKSGLNSFGQRFMELLERAITDAARSGVSRQAVAEGLGVSTHTLDAWLKPSRSSVIPGDRCFELVCREDILPQTVRDRFWRDVGIEGGYVAIPELHVDLQKAPALTHLIEIAAVFGRLAEVVRQKAGGPCAADNRVCPEDMPRMLEHLHDLEREVVELRLAIEQQSDDDRRRAV